MKLHPDLREWVRLCAAHHVEFLIVGGHAVAFHGYPRFTGDLDFLIRPTANNAERAIAALDAFGFGSIGLTREALLSSDTVIQLGRPPNRIDLLTSLSGVETDAAFTRGQAGTLDGLSVTYISRADLLTNKLATGRLKDLADVEALEG